jgi:RNA polymerase sigma-70 factor (ECF subfamily)
LFQPGRVVTQPRQSQPDPDDSSSTHWTLVARAGHPSEEVRRAALEALLRRYLGPMRRHLLSRRRVPPDRVDDLLQGFVCSRILEQDLIARADPARGRFRNYLLKALNRYVANELRRERTKARSPRDGELVPLDPDADEEAGPAAREPGPGGAFDLAWAREVLDEAVTRMRADCHAAVRPDVWGVFEARVVGPALGRHEPVPYAELVERFGFASPAQASNALVTANRMFQRVLRSVIARYELGDAAVEEEIADLRRIFARTRSS